MVRVDTDPEGKVWAAGESEGWKVYNTAEKDKTIPYYKLMISGIVLRPITFITINEQGVENLSPFSISFARNDHPGSLEDTRTFIENANATAIDTPPDFDEWSISSLTKEKCVQVKASRVKGSAFGMECEPYRTVDITHPVTGEHSSTLILAHIKYIHVCKDMLTERGGVDVTKFKPVARMGDISYARVGDAFRLTCPAWAQEEATIHDTLTTLATL
ncbi:hypothetical protein M405DRAFT_850111 [Rhizopogon salebrosus TDB-379]|nr:hypothetical protein M405DRAFT_850111 [Rhizopogon salebrosus TDB-379]